MIKISFSWDDGAIEDNKLKDLCIKYKIPSIFFIPAKNSERGVLSKVEIRQIFESGFEIGAHTFSHKYLTELDLQSAELELYNGKEYLQDIIGQEIPHFCFPGGYFNDEL